MGRNDTRFIVNYQNILVIWNLLNHEEMFVGAPIYIRYAVISIVLFTYILSIELFSITQLCSSLQFIFGCLPLFIPNRFLVYP